MTDITLIQYTDPNCTWSWGAEPLVRHVEALYGDQLTIEFVLGGLVEDFEEFHDAANDIRGPADVAPHWEEASRKHGMPVDVSLWEDDPPRSTYPASRAVKAAGLQDPALGLRYLRRIREVAAAEARNISRRSTLLDAAESVGIEVGPFVEALEDGRAERAFRRDRERMRRRGVRGFPTFELEVEGEARIIGGYQPFESLERALRLRAPGLERRSLPPVEGFVATYGYVATREVAEVYEMDRRSAEEELRWLARAGVLGSVRRGNGRFWMPAGEDGPERRGTGEPSLERDLEWCEPAAGEEPAAGKELAAAAPGA